MSVAILISWRLQFWTAAISQKEVHHLYASSDQHIYNTLRLKLDEIKYKGTVYKVVKQNTFASQ